MLLDSIHMDSVYISSETTTGLAIGGGVLLFLLLILLCVCLCCCCRRRKRRNDQENPPNSKGEHVDLPPPPPQVQEQQQLNNPSSMAKPHRMDKPNLPPSQFSSSSIGTVHSSKQSLPSYKSSSSSDQGPGNSSYPLNGHGTLAPSPPSPTPSFGSSQIIFTYNELRIATNGFSEGNFLGQGGFGPVHKGVLPNGKQVAVKSLKPNSYQGSQEFQAEVDIINRVHHKHLVSLVGHCVSGSNRLLVYEYVPNKTLEFHLHGDKQHKKDWSTRLKVAIGAAKGLAYLHEDCHPKIIHRDIKAANILLDNNFHAKVADFGLAKFSSEADTHVSTRIMGTLGYLAPEYAATGKLTEKSDVYSFGVMLLELITGRMPVDKNQDCNLVDWAKPLLTTAIEDENFNYLVDPQLQYCYKHSEMARMVSCAATCVRKSAKRRPLMSQVVRALEGNISLQDLNEGITPGRSMINRYQSSNPEYNDTKYKENSRDFPSNKNKMNGSSSEYSSWYGSSSSEGQSTRELDTQEVHRQNRQSPWAV